MSPFIRLVFGTFPIVLALVALTAHASPQNCIEQSAKWAQLKGTQNASARDVFAQNICSRDPSDEALKCMRDRLDHGVSQPQDVDPVLLGSLCIARPGKPAHLSDSDWSAATCFLNFRSRSLPVFKEGADTVTKGEDLMNYPGGYASSMKDFDISFGDDAAYEMCSKCQPGAYPYGCWNCTEEMIRHRMPPEASARFCASNPDAQKRMCFYTRVRAPGTDPDAAAALCNAPNVTNASTCFDWLTLRHVSQLTAARLCAANPTLPARECLVSYLELGLPEGLGARKCARDPASAPQDLGSVLQLLQGAPALGCLSDEDQGHHAPIVGAHSAGHGPGSIAN